jgi:hypothetical protein
MKVVVKGNWTRLKVGLLPVEIQHVQLFVYMLKITVIFDIVVSNQYGLAFKYILGYSVRKNIIWKGSLSDLNLVCTLY